MITLRRLLEGALMILFAIAMVFVVTSFFGFRADGYMIISAVMVIVTWGVLIALIFRTWALTRRLGGPGSDYTRTVKWCSRLFLTIAIHAVVTGLGLAFLSFVGCGCYWVPKLYHWLGFVTAILAFSAYFFLPLALRICIGKDESGTPGKPFQLWTKIFFPLAVASIWGLVWLIPFLLLKGSINESEYKWTGPGPAPVYKLPFPAGESSWVIQGNNSSWDHQIKDGKDQKYAWDFRRPCGTPILAARGGTVLKDPIQKNDGIGGDNNEIDVDQGDGTIGIYMHFQRNSAKVKKNDLVKPGMELATVGSVGNSLTGHIHFMVKDTKKNASKAITFQDVRDDAGIPRTFGTYTSGNTRNK